MMKVNPIVLRTIANPTKKNISFFGDSAAEGKEDKNTTMPQIPVNENFKDTFQASYESKAKKIAKPIYARALDTLKSFFKIDIDPNIPYTLRYTIL